MDPNRAVPEPDFGAVLGCGIMLFAGWKMAVGRERA
jgi:hypothetical protein